jgi:hypothetical protein
MELMLAIVAIALINNNKTIAAAKCRLIFEVLSL